MPGKHTVLWMEEMVKTISGSITTTMSICSVVTGYSRDMGRDLVWKEGTRDHPPKTNKKLATSQWRNWSRWWKDYRDNLL